MWMQAKGIYLWLKYNIIEFNIKLKTNITVLVNCKTNKRYSNTVVPRNTALNRTSDKYIVH